MKKSLSVSRRTPVDHDYGTCDLTYVDMLIYPSELAHENVTALLGIEPTVACNKGDRIETARGTVKVVPVTRWSLSSENDVMSKDVRAHLDWLLERLVPAREGLFELQQHHEVKMAVDCTWWSRSGHGGPTLWPEQMRQLAELNLECAFEIQFHPDGQIWDVLE